MRNAVSLLALLAAACATPGAATRPTPAPAAEPQSVQFAHDDFEGALARARDGNRPLYVDVWAPW